MNDHLMKIVALPLIGGALILGVVAWGTVHFIDGNQASIVVRNGTRSGTAVPADVDASYAKAFAETIVAMRTNWTASTYVQRMKQVVPLLDPDNQMNLQASVQRVVKQIKTVNQSKTGTIVGTQVTDLGDGIWSATVTAKSRIYFGSFAGGEETIEARIQMRQVPLAPPNPYILIATAYNEQVTERTGATTTAEGAALQAAITDKAMPTQPSSPPGAAPAPATIAPTTP